VAHGIFASDTIEEKGSSGWRELFHEDLCHLHCAHTTHDGRDAVELTAAIAHKFVSHVISNAIGCQPHLSTHCAQDFFESPQIRLVQWRLLSWITSIVASVSRTSQQLGHRDPQYQEGIQ
jgi:hypothetical protein